MGRSDPVVLLYWPRMKSEICSSLACSAALSSGCSCQYRERVVGKEMRYCFVGPGQGTSPGRSRRLVVKVSVGDAVQWMSERSGRVSYPCQGSPRSSRSLVHHRLQRSACCRYHQGIRRSTPVARRHCSWQWAVLRSRRCSSGPQ